MKIKGKIPTKPAPGAVVIVLVLAASYLCLTAEKGAPSYSVGDRWTWQVTRQELDPLTDNVTATRTYEQTIEYVGEETRDSYKGGIFKLTVSGQPTQYGQIFRVMEGTSTGTMTTGDTMNQIIITYEENLWYSESVKEAVKSTSETTTVVVTPLATSVTKTREERVLSSYSIG